MDTTAVPVGASFNLLKYLYHLVSKRNRNKRLRGYYLVHNQNNSSPVNKSPEGIPNFLKISIKWYVPDTIKIRSRDYDKRYTQTWKTWIGKITLHDDDYGYGWYRYLGKDEPGNHEIWLQEN